MRAEITFGEVPYASKPWKVRLYYGGRVVKSATFKKRADAETFARSYTGNVHDG